MMMESMHGRWEMVLVCSSLEVLEPPFECLRLVELQVQEVASVSMGVDH